MAEENLSLVQDWTDYDRSLVSTNSESYYKEHGIDLYSSNDQIPVPNEVTNSYPHALSLVKVLKELLQKHKKIAKLKILDAGCGSGIFARHFLIAAREENILDKVEILLADYSKTALKDIKKKNILDGFAEIKNYRLLELDLFNLDNCKELNGKKYELKNLDLIVLNYIYDSLPMIVLRPSIDSETSYEKLQFKLLTDNPELTKSKDLIKQNIGTLLIEDRWQAYKIEEQSELQQKHYQLLDPSKTNHIGQIFYNYASIELTEKLGERLSEYGFIYAADMPHNQSIKNCFQVYGNTVAHFINEPLITKHMNDLKYSSLVTQDTLLIKIFYFKNHEIFKNLDEILKKLFIESSLTDIYADLRQCISIILSPHSKEIHKFLLDKLTELDPFSCFSHMARAGYFLKQGDEEKAKKIFESVKKLDFLRDYH